jgi:hypothetical protein
MRTSKSPSVLEQREQQLTAEVLQSFNGTSSPRVRELLADGRKHIVYR